MAETFLSQRQFAKMASISPATLQKLIANKEIRVDPATGKISSLEYQNILMNELKTYKSKNALIIGIGSGTMENELAHELALKYTANYPQHYFESLISIFDTITGETLDSNAREDVVQYEYNKYILKEFSNRYKSMVKNYKLSILDNRKFNEADDGEFYRLPYFITDELFMYGRVISITDEGEKEAVQDLVTGVENMNKEIQYTLNSKFEALMNELNLIINNELIFTRDDLTPEFFKQEGELYNAFFKGAKPGDLASKIPVDNKLLETIALKVNNTHSKSNIHSLLSDGFVMDSFLDLSDIAASWTKVSVLLYSGLFADVIILATEKDYNAVVPEYIRQAVTVAKATSKFSIEFM